MRRPPISGIALIDSLPTIGAEENLGQVGSAVARLRAMREALALQGAAVARDADGEIAAMPMQSRAERLVELLLQMPPTADLQRRHMLDSIRSEMLARGAHIDAPRLEIVLAAMAKVPRDHFVHADASAFAYLPAPLDIGDGQTISHPQMVAVMLYAGCIQPLDRVLDVGTGCGYQAAVAAGLARHVTSVEVIPRLAQDAAARLARLQCLNVDTLVGDARSELPNGPLFDVILVAAGAKAIPAFLIGKLAVGGRLVMPVGEQGRQQLVVLRRNETNVFLCCALGPANFVRLVGDGDPEDLMLSDLPWCFGQSITPPIDRG